MQYDQCLTKGPDGSKIMITHCNQNEFKEWQFFKVRNRYMEENTFLVLISYWVLFSFKTCYIYIYIYLKLKICDKVE